MNSLGMEFVRVPAGQFRMGAHAEEPEALSDEKPQHTVTLTQPFWMGRFTVTREQYTHLISNRHRTGDTNLPAYDLSSADAEQFCKALSELPEEVTAGRSYRLPTEAEWEHACRAGTFTTFSFGDRPTAALVNSQPGYLDNEWDYYYRGSLTPVGTYPANGFGLHEMHGNIWEWCSDWYNSQEYERGDVVDPRNDTPSLSRITRGGCYAAAGASCRSARRGTARPQDHTPYSGFRVVMVQREESSP
jgi:formylglycine-generating enzyme required for sulfatase activity